MFKKEIPSFSKFFGLQQDALKDYNKDSKSLSSILDCVEKDDEQVYWQKGLCAVWRIFGTRLKNAPFLKAMSFSMHILLSKKVSKLAPISRSIDWWHAYFERGLGKCTEFNFGLWKTFPLIVLLYSYLFRNIARPDIEMFHTRGVTNTNML